MKKKIVFRVDSSIEIGSGHVMRCLTLADQLKDGGSHITFISRDHEGNLGSVIRKRGYEVVSLPKPFSNYIPSQSDATHAHWLGVSWEQDAKDVCDIIGSTNPDWLIVDHYGIDARWHQMLLKFVKQIFVIDDLADRELCCNLLLDQTYGRSQEDYDTLVPGMCKKLLGSQFAMIKPEFAILRPQAIEKRKRFVGVETILVSMGGMDPFDITSKALEALNDIPWKNSLFVDIVLGGKSPSLKKVKHLADKLQLKSSISIDVSDMALRMLNADLAIGAGGSTLWERCCLGLPALIVTTAKNQVFAVESVCRQGAIRGLGSLDVLNVEKISKEVDYINSHPEVWLSMSNQSFKVTSGTGVQEISKLVLA